MATIKIFLSLLSVLIFFNGGDSAVLAPVLPPICAAVLCAVPDCPNPIPPGPGECCSTCPPATRPLKCPKLRPDSFGLCVELCSADDDCPKGQLCCSNGCGHQCMVGVPDVCVVNGVTYHPGDSFPASDGCNTCMCNSGGLVACTEKACLGVCVQGDTVYNVGDSFPAGDGCNFCSCAGPNRILCTLIACEEPTTLPPPSPTCPPDNPPVNCFEDPCNNADCPAHPEARCVADYCGGCNARFFIGDREVTDTCRCPVKGQVFKECGSACPANCTTPNPICTKQCVPRCECPRGQVIDETRNKCVPVRKCCPVKGQVFTNCGSACPANCTIPNPICTRQCVPRCECPRGQVIDQSTNRCVPVRECPNTCPPNKPRVYCFVDPCMFARCPAHPKARCVADYCGGCNARFFDGENEVTSSCRVSY